MLRRLTVLLAATLANQRGEVTVTDPPAPVDPPAPTDPPVDPPAPVDPPTDPPVDPPQTTVPLSALEAERKKRREAREEAAYWRGVAEAGGKAPTATSAPAAPAVPTAPVAPVKPKRLNSQDFDDWEQYEAAQEEQDNKYQAARDQYIIDKVNYDNEQKIKQQSQQQSQQQKESAYVERLHKAAELDPELLDIAANFHLPGQYHLPLTDTIQDTILESEVGPEMLRHLYNNKQEAIRIARLSPVAAVKELVKIENAIQAKPSVKKVSSAPPPAAPVVGGRGTVETDDDKRSAADVIAEYRKASARRR